MEGFSLGLDCSCGLKRAGVVGVPALIGFLGLVWLLPAGYARHPWQCARAKGDLFPAPASAPFVVAPSPDLSGYGATTNLPKEMRPGISKNFALAQHGAKARGGFNPGELLDGNCTEYEAGTGYANTTWSARPPQFFTVTLKDPVTIDCVRFLLWDRDERYYRYKLEVCADDKGETWAPVADHTGPAEKCRSWQVVRFKAQPVKLIRLTGTYNSANRGFHVVELQASLGLPAATPSPGPVEVLEF